MLIEHPELVKALRNQDSAMPMEGWERRWISWGFLIVSIVFHIGFILSLWTGALNSLFYDTQYLLGQGADFFSYYQEGYNVLNGLDCYAEPDIQVVPYLYPYRYLPYFAYTFGAILNLVPPLLAYWLWVGILLVVLWLAVIRTRQLTKALHRPDWEGRVAMAMWFIFSPVYIELFLGQVTLFAAVLMFFALTNSSFVNGQKTRGTMTVFWTASGLTKLIPFFITPVLLGAGKVRSVLVAVIVMVVAIVAVPAGLESFQYFINFNTARTMYLGPYVGSHSLKMLLYYLFGESTGDFRMVTGLLVGVFFILSIIATLYSRDLWSCTGLFSLTYFFIMTDVWEHHYTFILPLLVLAWVRGQPEDKARWIPLALLLLMSLPMLPIVAFLSGLSPGAHPIIMSSVWQIVYHSSKVVPALLFFGWLFVTAFRSPRESSFLKGVRSAFRNVWKGFIKGSNLPAEAGVLVHTKLDDSKHI
ncbi:MAG: glycosyltransferase family 87 protein [Candidatus Thorarchaeota archaeon]